MLPLLECCLPVTLESIPFTTHVSEGGAVFTSRSLNLRRLMAGQIGADQVAQAVIAGVAFGSGSPLVQVVEFGGRAYLKNGYHRAAGLLEAGHTFMPCVLIAGTSFEDTGAVPGAGFAEAVLVSTNPPTCGHFRDGIAYPVDLRQTTRVIAVNWSEYVIVEP